MRTATEFAANLFEVGAPVKKMACEVDDAFAAVERAKGYAHAAARDFRKEVRKLWTQAEIESALGGKAHRGCPHARSA